jgi:rSAM/selenodomain-associated transferase 2
VKVSVIIPALNEAKGIGGAVASAAGAAEVIVADGGSSDGTVEAALGSGARVVRSAPGRGLQMDEASRAASGDVLLFLHADTRLPPLWRGAVADALDDRGVAGGAFSLSFDSDAGWFRLLERAVALRCRALGLVYGDQAIFARKEAFSTAGGFRGLPLMEDVDCVRRLKRLGRVVVLRDKVTTSSRRWMEGGLVANTLKNLVLLSLYFLGLSPERLYAIYYGRGNAGP